jgi:hypothetical protein
VAISNSKLAKMLEKEEAKKSKAKEKQKESRPPPPPRLSPAHRGTPPLEVYVAHEFATVSSIRCKTAGPSTSTGIPDQPAGVSNANLNQQQAEGRTPTWCRYVFAVFFPFLSTSVLCLVISSPSFPSTTHP